MTHNDDSKLPSAGAFLRILEDYGAADCRYDFCADVKRLLFVPGAPNTHRSVLNLLPSRHDWQIEDLLCFDHHEFVELASFALRGRRPSPAEYRTFDTEDRVWRKLDFILALDAENRRERRGPKVKGIEWEARLWRLADRLRRPGLLLLRRLILKTFRERVRRLSVRLGAALSLRRLTFECLHRLNEVQSRSARRARKVVIANLYPVWPVTHGGQRRVFFLARELSKHFDVEIVVPHRLGSNSSLSFGPGFQEIRIATETGFNRLADAVDDTVKMASDAAYAKYWPECRAYQHVLAERLRDADIAISTHAYSIGALIDALGDRSIPIVYDAHNVEVRLKQPLLERHPALLDAVRTIERTAVERADLIVSCSEDDRDGLVAEYGVDRARIELVENGVDALGVPRLAPDQLGRVRADLGIGSRLVAIFGGSYHYPNFEAVARILRAAEHLPHIVFLLVGTVCWHDMTKAAKPDNVVCLGEIDESTKWAAYLIADVALNPIDSGSGSNIKLFEYAAAGLPVMTTRFGARGAGSPLREHLILVETGDLETSLRNLAAMDREELRRLGAGARVAARATADWSTIGRRYADHVASLLRTETREEVRPPMVSSDA
jgi:glycosyltransferase involved in cell wall biosynthesis